MNNIIKRRIFDSIVWSVSVLFAFGLLIDSAMAESSGPVATNKSWKAECGSCHVAYPPNLLPASSWRRIMGGLRRHFGTDASVDAASAVEIGAFLERNAGSGKRGSEAALRITETRWFLRKHDEVAPATWNKPQVKTAANCGACHSGAERGDFDEDAVRIPR
jgi:nitrate/TMAO reductase-like tetraheme cytochrome c subunit